MKRSDAKEIAEIITNAEMQEMLRNARANIKDWSAASKSNKGISKGVAWNIIKKGFSPDNPSFLYNYRAIIEFGEYLPEHLKPVKTERKIIIPVHQEPDDLPF